MFDVLSATVPIFLVVALGFALTRSGMFKRSDMTTLSRFVVTVALPLLIFLNVHGRSPTELFHPTYLLTYASAAVVMYALAWAYGRVMHRSAHRITFMGLSMAGTNNGFIGFAVFLILIPEWAGVAIGMDMIVDNVLIIPLALLLAEQAAGQGTVLSRLKSTVRGVLLHPMVIAIALALVLNTVDFELPEMIERATGMVAGAASGVALFCVGGMLTGLRIHGAVLDVVVSVAGKLLVMPAVGIGLVVAYTSLGLPELPAPLQAAVILTCALPQYTIVPVLAEQYGEGDVATAAMLTATALSFLTLSGWMLTLQAMGWM